MARVLVHVEGQTEEVFVREVLLPHLRQFGHEGSARLIGNSRLRSRRGGIRPWPTVRRDILNHLREDSSAFATTMVDYYGLPATGDGAWPGRLAASRIAFGDRAPAMLQELADSVASEMGPSFDPGRFIPFVVFHEFEGLLFSDCDRFAAAVGKRHLAPQFAAVRAQFNSPEEINDSSATAPSKRVEKLLPEYQKPLHGNIAILEIGLKAIRQQCPIFSDWVAKLERIPR
jgi:hypothetical protein